ncbi:MAG TPA: response regulator transcription factor [Fimbriiglobus sp.]|jgi:DNA-binding NarL/FixJ family response regulator|nr:response regulator transcription factor [Fimbriiglobus sp.]
MKHDCVLVADSHPEMLGAVQRILQDQFGTVVMVADEESLLAAIPRLQPDLVVVDLSLPVAGYRNIAAVCGEKFPSLGVIVLSVYDEPEAAAAAMRTGAKGYVLKRTAAADLVEAVAAVLGGNTYVSPGVGPLPG